MYFDPAQLEPEKGVLRCLKCTAFHRLVFRMIKFEISNSCFKQASENLGL